MDCDILVIGAGILGLSSAYHMKKRDPSRKIIVVDRFGSPGQGNSAKSEGGFRNVFTSQTNYLLADSTIDFYTHLEKNLGYDLKLHFIGYLWLFSKEQYRSLAGAIEEIRSRGVEIRVYSREELKELLPILITDLSDNEEAELLGLPDIHYGVYGVKCGSLDPDSLVRCYEQEFLKLGGEILYNTEVQCLLLKPEEELGIPGEVEEQVLKWAKLAKEAGLDGIVCSAADLYSVKDKLPKDFFYITPGVRPVGVSHDDQKRVFTPGNAVKAGSSLLVIGRAILKAEDRRKAAYEILQDIARVL